jgi:hypothetical protein
MITNHSNAYPADNMRTNTKRIWYDSVRVLEFKKKNYYGNYWYLDLKEWLLEEGFDQSRASPSFFCKLFSGGFFIKFNIYVDEKWIFGNNEIILTELK